MCIDLTTMAINGNQPNLLAQIQTNTAENS
jgi:hypothetical protein